MSAYAPKDRRCVARAKSCGAPAVVVVMVEGPCVRYSIMLCTPCWDAFVADSVNELGRCHTFTAKTLGGVEA